jgi:hypothetical protein
MSVGQLWARSGQVSGLRAGRPRLCAGAGRAQGTLPPGGCFRRSQPCGRCRPVPLGPAESHCGQLRRGRLADGIRPEVHRILWASGGPQACPQTGIRPSYVRPRTVSAYPAAACLVGAAPRLARSAGAVFNGPPTKILSSNTAGWLGRRRSACDGLAVREAHTMGLDWTP